MPVRLRSFVGLLLSAAGLAQKGEAEERVLRGFRGTLKVMLTDFHFPQFGRRTHCMDCTIPIQFLTGSASGDWPIRFQDLAWIRGVL